MAFQRIKVDPGYADGVPHVGDEHKVPVSTVVSTAAEVLYVSGVLSRLPGLTREDVEQSMAFAAAAVRTGGLPMGAALDPSVGVRDVVVSEVMWPQLVEWLGTLGMLVARMPSNLLPKDSLPTYVIVPGPGLFARPQLALYDYTRGTLVDIARARGGRLTWSQTIPLDAGTIEVTVDVEVAKLNDFDHAFVLGIERAVREFLSMRGRPAGGEPATQPATQPAAVPSRGYPTAPGVPDLGDDPDGDLDGYDGA